MEINGINIKIAQAGTSQQAAGNGDTASVAKSRSVAPSDSSNAGGSQAPAIPQPHALNSLTNSNFIKDQIEEIMFSFPPYFPIGSPQRIDMIKGVRGVQEEIKKSPLPPEVKDRLAGQELKDTATDKEIITALQGVKQYKEEHSPAPSKSAESGQPAKIVSISI